MREALGVELFLLLAVRIQDRGDTFFKECGGQVEIAPLQDDLVQTKAQRDESNSLGVILEPCHGDSGRGE